MAEPTGLDMIGKILGQIYNLHELIKIGNDVYKLDKKDGKYRNKAGKTWTRPQLIDYVKGQEYKAPNVPKPNSKLKVKTTPKPTTNPLQVGKEKLNTFTQNRMNERWLNKRQNERNPRVDKQGLTKIGRANMNTGRLQSGGGLVNQVLGAVIGETEADLRFGNWIGNRIFSGPDYTYDEVQAMKAEKLANQEMKIQRDKQLNANKRERQNTILEMRDQTGTQQTGGTIGRRPEQGIVRPKPTSKKVDKNENNNERVKVSQKKEDKKDWTPPEGFFSNTEKKKGTKPKIKTEKKKDKNKVLMIGDKKASPIQKKLLKAGFTADELKTLVDAYDEKYRSKRGW